MTASSESLLELLDNGDTSSNTPQRCLAPREYDEEVNGRVREERERERRRRDSVEDGEESDDERGFEYMTTANIARHLRSDNRGGMCYYMPVGG